MLLPRYPARMLYCANLHTRFAPPRVRCDRAAGMGHTMYSLKGEVDRSGSSRSARVAANACATQGRSSSPPSFLSTHENSKGIVVARYFTVAVSSATWRLRSRTSWRAQSSLAAAMVSAQRFVQDCADLILNVILICRNI